MKLFKTKIIRTALASAAILAIALGMGGASTGAANAGNLGIDLYLGNGTGIYYSNNKRYNRPTRYSGYRNRHHQWQNNGPRYRNHDYRRHGKYYQPPRRQFCGPRRAVKKAHRLGLKNPQVRRIMENRIVVSGYQYGYRAKMIFKRHSNCRLIR